VEEEDERKKKDSGRAYEVEMLKTLSCSCSPLYRHTGQSENLQDMTLQYNTTMTIHVQPSTATMLQLAAATMHNSPLPPKSKWQA